MLLPGGLFELNYITNLKSQVLAIAFHATHTHLDHFAHYHDCYFLSFHFFLFRHFDSAQCDNYWYKKSRCGWQRLFANISFQFYAIKYAAEVSGIIHIILQIVLIIFLPLIGLQI